MSAINQNFMHSFSYARRQKKGASVLIQIEKYSEGKKINFFFFVFIISQFDYRKYFPLGHSILAYVQGVSKLCLGWLY